MKYEFLIVLMLLFLLGCDQATPIDLARPGVIIFRNGMSTYCERIQVKERFRIFYTCFEKDGVTQYWGNDVSAVKQIYPQEH